MADTRRAKTALQTLLADNTTGQISAQDLRDFLVTVLGGYGCITLADGSTAQTGLSATPAKITGFDTDGPAVGFTVDSTTNNRITVDIDCACEVALHMSFSGSVGKEFDLHIYKSGVDTGYGMHCTLDAGGEVQPASCGGLLDCSAADYIEVYISSPDGGTSITPTDMQLIVKQIG